MDLKARQNGNVIVLDLSGRIDVDAANLIEAVGQCLRDGYLDVLCNFEEVEFIDYMGLSVITIAYREVLNFHGRMKFCNIPTHLRSFFAVSGMDKIIDIYPSEELAVNNFKEDKIIENIKKMQLRRRFKRLPIDIKVELKPKYGKSPVCLRLDILNLSAIGAYIYGCREFKLGDEVILKMKLVPHPEELELEAKVVWLPDKQVQNQVYPGMGIEFEHLSGEVQKRILEFIDRNLSCSSTDN